MCGRYLTPDEADRDEQDAGAILGHNRTDVAACQVSFYVNKPVNNDAECIRPIERRGNA
jgi:putative SOS response-associated peptidase YedK